jgi:hypothetical protein
MFTKGRVCSAFLKLYLLPSAVNLQRNCGRIAFSRKQQFPTAHLAAKAIKSFAFHRIFHYENSITQRPPNVKV